MQFGTVEFETSCSDKTKKDFNLGMALLHSFEYDESEKVFAKIIEESPECAMAYWGVAMSNFHPLWAPPTQPELQKGAKAIEIAKSITKKTPRETAYIDAIGEFYSDWDKLDHGARTGKFVKSMEQLYTNYPNDKEAAIFYALALDAAAKPTDKTYANQKKAADILNKLYASEPNHPGIIHYIIHTYDYPELANLGLQAARKYASVAPSSAHALHMPSHIFTRLGLWDEAIKSNSASVAAAICYAESAGIKGHWDEELHGLDYLVYAYLQKGENDSARAKFDYLKRIEKVSPTNFKVAYAFAAIPARIALENKDWKEAAEIEIASRSIPWVKFPWQEAIIHYAKALGLIHIGALDDAKTERGLLGQIRDSLLLQKNSYSAKQVEIQLNTVQAWWEFKSGYKEQALTTMQLAARMEDSTEKHSVTPGEVLPARELLADMYLEMGKPALALKEYEAVLEKRPNRFNALYNAGYAAEKINEKEKAKQYYTQLLAITENTHSDRPELNRLRNYLAQK